MSTTNILDLNNRIDALEKIAHNVEPIQQQIDELKAWTDSGTKDASGNPIILTDGAAFNAVDLKVSLSPKQSGSGTPSPDNIRPFTGYTECNVDTLPNADYAPYFEGVKNGTHGFVDLGTLTYSYLGNNVFATTGITEKANGKTNFLVFGYITVDSSWENLGDKEVTGALTSGTIHIKNSGYTDTTAFKTAMSGVYLIYELATPTTPSYTIQQWIALVNSFNGNDATIAFGQTVYGVSVDAKTGKTMVTHAIVDLSTFTWSDYQTNCKITSELANIAVKPSGSSVKANILAEKYENETSYNVVNNQTTKAQICINISGTLIVSDGGTGTSPTGNMTYELATPIELTLTPAELELLKGYNYITTNGDNIELTYQPDTLKADILLTVSQLYGSKISIMDGILTGGTTGQVLTKTSDDNYDATWETLPATRTTTKKSDK